MSKPPFRADHVGSLLRPSALHDMREKVKKGELPREALAAEEDRHIREVVKLQEDVGIPSVTDGEFRRDWWHIDFIHRMRRSYDTGEDENVQAWRDIFGLEERE